ncbi:molybdopterin converting factor subunit 1 [Paenibacillus sp. YYML68]|uniref:molybdopterin converting factor subunit 1 n=1 Tax=Paenibacillus sp. YYML68 TaxID=2909250 RepID=UPI002491F03A|nr:molybdopterin converting factor subunit 1 [Paenibacillus sp. YYML68]
MKLKVLLFAGLADVMGARYIEVDTEQHTLSVTELKTLLAQRHPQARGVLATAYVAINQEYAAEDAPIHENDEVAIIPPVSGGEPEWAELTYEPIIPDQVTAKVLHPNHGASLCFIGTTREWTNGQRTLLLEYEAYEPMAIRKLEQLVDEIKERWPGTLCAVTHRLGPVAVGEISVVIAVSSPHRDAVYEANRYAIERLKQVVPIWKRERWEDGSEWKGHQTGPWNPLAPVAREGGLNEQ